MRRVLVETNDGACVLVDAPKPQYDDDDGDGEASTADDEKHLCLSNRENSPTRAGANLFGIACELRCIPTVIEHEERNGVSAMIIRGPINKLLRVTGRGCHFSSLVVPLRADRQAGRLS